MPKCKVCREPFVRRSITQKVCDYFVKPSCALEYAQTVTAKNKEKAERKDRVETKEKLKAFKTLPDYKREAQTAFNAYIRARDKGKPCICCGLDLGLYEIGGAFDCGHYRSVGSAPHLRYNEDNAHGQRKKCNRWDGGRAVDYRIGLIKRIGIERVEALESDNQPAKYTIEDLKEIIKKYKAKLKEVQNLL